MARSRYVFTLTTPSINEETAKAFKIMNQTLGFEVIANSQDGDGYEFRPVLQDAANQIPQENEQMTEVQLKRRRVSFGKMGPWGRFGKSTEKKGKN